MSCSVSESDSLLLLRVEIARIVAISEHDPSNDVWISGL